MTPTQAKEILKEYQSWSLGSNPKVISEAIEIILLEFKPKRKIKRKIIYTKNNFN